MSPQEAREWARECAIECPNCHSQVVLEIDAPHDVTPLLRQLTAAGATKRLVPIEEAEEQARTGHFVLIDPVERPR